MTFLKGTFKNVSVGLRSGVYFQIICLRVPTSGNVLCNLCQYVTVSPFVCTLACHKNYIKEDLLYQWRTVELN